MPGDTAMDVVTPYGTMSADLSRIAGDGSWQGQWQVRVAATYRWGSFIPVDANNVTAREQRRAEKAAAEELVKLKRLISISIKKSFNGLLTAAGTIESRRENVTTAEEGLRIATESYKAGVIKNSELLAAQLSLTRARTEYINAVNAYYLSLAELRRELGPGKDIISGGTR